MYINSIQMKDFMLFSDKKIEFSKNINIISGENSTGKTALLKVLYSTGKSIYELNKEKDTPSLEKKKEIVSNKLKGVFRPDDDKLGRLVKRAQGCKSSEVLVEFYDKKQCNQFEFSFTNRAEKYISKIEYSLDFGKNISPIYIPPKEIISATENFSNLYEEWHIAFEETYYDLCKLLSRPKKKGRNTEQQNQILNSLEKILDGSIVQENKKFYLVRKGQGKIEMGLLSEGYRKLATIIYLISVDAINSNAILFWDEPESNMNPRMIKPIVEMIVELAKMGVQIFITTHNYFIQQEFSMLQEYKKNNKLDIRFLSLYNSEEGREVNFEQGHTIAELNHNAILEEFNNLYDREQELFYE